jgi:hypothetical protein
VLVLVMVSGAMAATAVSLLATGDQHDADDDEQQHRDPDADLHRVAGEVRLGAESARLARRLEAEGGLPYDPPGVQRLPSGRLEKADADAAFERRRAEVEAAPEDWRAWWRLAAAYGEARDARRGRRAMRKAVALERAERG